MSGKKISVILPVYNGEQYLAEALESILSQTYTNLEVIIVDDCSTDHTAEIIERYINHDQRIRCIKNSVNLKLPRTLNVGFANATGDYLTWTSDDNKYKTDALERMAYQLDAKLNIDMVYADYTAIDTNGRIIGEVQLGDPYGLLYGNVIGGCFLYKRDLLDRVGEYDPNLFLAEDYDYWIRIWKAGTIVHMHENLYFYRRHEGSLTASRHEQIYNQTYRLVEKHFLFMYLQLRNRKDKNRFMEAMEKWGQYQDRQKIRHQIYSIYPGYRWHILYKNIKHRVWEKAHQVKEKIK